jgi:hypothetical protein
MEHHIYVSLLLKIYMKVVNYGMTMGFQRLLGGKKRYLNSITVTRSEIKTILTMFD